jgi:hypothetical protein
LRKRQGKRCTLSAERGLTAEGRQHIGPERSALLDRVIAGW